MLVGTDPARVAGAACGARGPSPPGALWPRAVRITFRLAHALVALATLASAVAVLVSDLAVAGYREHYRDAVWFVAIYVAVQAGLLAGFLRDGPHVKWLALVKAIAAWLFLANFFVLWPYWKMWTPARYVYLVFEQSNGSQLALMAFVLLGRGAFNTLSAFYFTREWWMPLRDRMPLVGRIVTMLPVAVAGLCVWFFVALAAEEYRTFSPEAYAVAEEILATAPCEQVRERAGTTTEDVRQRDDRRYEVRITWACELTRVIVRTPDGRLGTFAAPRTECCEG